MSEREKFLQRWSRRKVEAEDEDKRGQAKPEASDEDRREQAKPEAPAENPPSASVSAPAKEKEPIFDPKTLPPLDSIGAETDVSVFLAPGVPEELKYAALQRVWRSDPAIRDFVELLENSWDFNDPNGAHGFGPLEVTEKMKQAVEAMFESLTEQRPEENLDDLPSPSPAPEAVQRQLNIAMNDQIPETDREADPGPARVALPQTGKKMSDHNPQRGHGGALPK